MCLTMLSPQIQLNEIVYIHTSLLRNGGNVFFFYHDRSNLQLPKKREEEDNTEK